MNIFAYSNGDPVNWIDPDGLRMRLLGTDLERQQLLNIINKMSGSQLTLVNDGYLVGKIGDGVECMKKCLSDVINGSNYVEIKFDNTENAYVHGGGHWTSNNHSIEIAPEHKDPGQTHFTYTSKGKITWTNLTGSGPQLSISAEETVAHELSHACDHYDGYLKHDNYRARQWEDAVRRYHGRPERN